MATTNQIYIARSVAADKVDSLVKTGKAAFELRNGDIVAVGAKAADGTFTLTKPAADSTLLAVVCNAGVETIEGYRIGDDPRKIAFAAGTPVNFYFPQVGDEVAYTVVTGYTDGTSKYLGVTVGDTALTASASAKTSGFNYEITGTSYVSVGGQRVQTIEAMLVPLAAE